MYCARARCHVSFRGSGHHFSIQHEERMSDERRNSKIVRWCGSWGFISGAGAKDTFFHKSHWQGKDQPQVGTRVEYNLTTDRNGRRRADMVSPVV